MFEIRRHVSDHQFQDVNNDHVPLVAERDTGISCFHSVQGHKMLEIRRWEYVYFWNSPSVFGSFVGKILNLLKGEKCYI